MTRRLLTSTYALALVLAFTAAPAFAAEATRSTEPGAISIAAVDDTFPGQAYQWNMAPFPGHVGNPQT